MRGTNCLADWFLILCILPSCAVTRPGRLTVPISAVDGFMLQSPELGPALSAIQEITIEFPDGSREKFLSIVENNHRTLRIALLNMLGQTLVVLSFSDGEVMVDLQGPIPAAMEPVRILGYLQIVLWPQSSVSSGLSGKLNLVESGGDLEIQDSNGPILLVEREGDCCPYSTTVITHSLEGWKIRIQTVVQ